MDDWSSKISLDFVLNLNTQSSGLQSQYICCVIQCLKVC